MHTSITMFFPVLVLGCGEPIDSALETPETGNLETTQTNNSVVPPASLNVNTESLLVTSHHDGISVYNKDGEPVSELPLSEAINPPSLCGDLGCGGQGISLDSNGFLASYMKNGDISESGVVRFSLIDDTLAPDWQINGLESYVHDMTRMPGKQDGLIIAETLDNKISWFASKTDSEPIVVIDTNSPIWPSNVSMPNGIDQFSSQGRDFLLVNWRQDRQMPKVAGGLISLWEITDPFTPISIWNYPETGRLAQPHGATLRYHDGEIYLLYGHSASLSLTEEKRLFGTVGVAKSSSLFTAPTYFADIYTDSDYPFTLEYPRYADLTSNGNLTICSSGPNGWIWEVPLPTLSSTDKSGAHTSDYNQMNIIYLNGGRVLVEDLEQPFEARFWAPTQ